jgi:hypothetical protein
MGQYWMNKGERGSIEEAKRFSYIFRVVLFGKITTDFSNIKVNIPAYSTWSGLLSYFQGIKITRFTKW